MAPRRANPSSEADRARMISMVITNVSEVSVNAGGGEQFLTDICFVSPSGMNDFEETAEGR